MSQNAQQHGIANGQSSGEQAILNRARFEAAWRARYKMPASVPFSEFSDGLYLASAVNDAYEGWQMALQQGSTLHDRILALPVILNEFRVGDASPTYYEPDYSGSLGLITKGYKPEPLVFLKDALAALAGEEPESTAIQALPVVLNEFRHNKATYTHYAPDYPGTPGLVSRGYKPDPLVYLKDVLEALGLPPAAAAGAVVEDDNDFRGPITDAQINEIRAYAATAHGGLLGRFDDIINKACVVGYMNGRHDFAMPEAAPAADGFDGGVDCPECGAGTDHDPGCKHAGTTLGKRQQVAKVKPFEQRLRELPQIPKTKEMPLATMRAMVAEIDEYRKLYRIVGSSAPAYHATRLREFGLKVGYEIGGWVDGSADQPDVEAIVSQILALPQFSALISAGVEPPAAAAQGEGHAQPSPVHGEPEVRRDLVGYADRHQLDWLAYSQSDTASIQLWKRQIPVDAVPVYIGLAPQAGGEVNAAGAGGAAPTV
jgi:hypothetical protein